MTQRSIDEKAQAKRRKNAWESALTASGMLLLSGLLLLGLRWYFSVEGFLGAVLLILSLLDLGMIIPVWILLKTRLKEIEGGEEDVAAQY
ncbi:MAG: hypothetical protein ACI4PO_06970 [Faecousia sp.]